MKIKKLNLKRETIRDLSSSELDGVAGGGLAPLPEFSKVSCLISVCDCPVETDACPNPTNPPFMC